MSIALQNLTTLLLVFSPTCLLRGHNARQHFNEGSTIMGITPRTIGHKRTLAKRKRKLFWEYQTQPQHLCMYASKNEKSEVFLISDKFDRAPVRAVLHALLPSVSHKKEGHEAYLTSLMNNGRVRIDGRIVKDERQKIAAGSKLSVHPKKFFVLPQHAKPDPVSVLYEDESVIALSKPSDMVVAPDMHHSRGTLLHALARHLDNQMTCKNESTLQEEHSRFGLVQRLDQDTTGVLLVSKTLYAQHKLIEAFSNRCVQKIYLAVLAGVPQDGAVVSEPIGRHPIKKKYAVMSKGEGQPAITHFQLLATDGHASLVAVRIGTGRTHQIRVHAEHLGCPVLGDTLYSQKKRGQHHHVSRLLLHAFQLQVPHPLSGHPLTIRASPPRDLVQLGASLVGGAVSGFDDWLAQHVDSKREFRGRKKFQSLINKLKQAEIHTSKSKFV